MKRSILILIVFALAGAGAGLLWTSVQPSNGSTGSAIPWDLTGMGGVNSSAAQNTTDPRIVRVHVESWPVDFNGDSWLTQTVEEGSDRVIITLRPSPAYQQRLAQNVQANGLVTIGMYDTGGWVDVHLHDPLGGRTLLDGSSSPPVPRS